MKHIFLALLLFSPLLLLAQDLKLVTPMTDYEDRQSDDFTFEVADASLKITGNFFNIFEKQMRREIYTAPLNVIDTIILAIDKNETACQIRVFAANDEETIEQHRIKLYPFFNDTQKRKSLYLGMWKIEHKDKLLDLVSQLNNKIPEQSIERSTTIKTRLAPMGSGMGHSSLEDITYYHEGKEMPSFRNSKTIEDRDRVIQDYINECVEQQGFKKSGMAMADMVIMEDGTIGRVYVSYSSDKGEDDGLSIEEFVKKNLLKMPKWKPGIFAKRLANIQVSTYFTINTDEDKMTMLLTQLDASEKFIKKKRPPKTESQVPVFIPDDVFETTDDYNVVHSVVEENPTYKKGDDVYLQFLLDSSEQLKRDFPNDKGTIRIRFVVERNGKVAYPQILRTSSHEAGEAAMKLINTVGDWNPGKQRGKIVRVYRYAIFKL